MFDPKTILVLAPHTDDGELGCGGSVSKFIAENKQVYYAAFSTCTKSLAPGLPPDTLARECKKATSVLGIPAANITLFDFEVRTFPNVRQEILEEMVKLGRKIKPDLVFIPSATDIHQDHGVIHTEALRAFKNCSLLGYELPWNHAQFNSTFFINLSGTDIVKKAGALKVYLSQAHRNYMQEDFITSLARVRGVQANTQYAEAFEVYKLIS
ncbi:MAG: PIG-L deacetylase family protein [Bacteroidota bacterium]|nr:PIG-L deacetylase family protein [Bacteroidota bacterium]